MRGILFVISGPSGCGKTTLGKRLLSRISNLTNSVSATTRLPRKGEKKKIDYIYTTLKRFKQDIKKNRFLEYAKVFGNYYGTPKRFVLEKLNKGKDVLLSIDVQGASQIKKKFPKAVLIFIAPPTFSALKTRLLKRSSDSPQQIKKRLCVARRELKTMCAYDYVIINDKMAKATKELVAIVKAARCKVDN
jgi:guanylate kinase